MKKDVISINDVMIDSSNIAHKNDSLNNILEKSSSNRILTYNVTGIDENGGLILEFDENCSIGEPLPSKIFTNSYYKQIVGLDVSNINKIKITGYIGVQGTITEEEFKKTVLWFSGAGDILAISYLANNIKSIKNGFACYYLPSIINLKKPQDQKDALGLFLMSNLENTEITGIRSNSCITIEVLE